MSAMSQSVRRKVKPRAGRGAGGAQGGAVRKHSFNEGERIRGAERRAQARRSATGVASPSGQHGNETPRAGRPTRNRCVSNPVVT